jgi:hypothetical protein
MRLWRISSLVTICPKVSAKRSAIEGPQTKKKPAFLEKAAKAVKAHPAAYRLSGYIFI